MGARGALAVAFVASIIAFFLYRASAFTGVGIEPISLPESLQKAGFTSEGVTNEFTEQMRALANDTDWGRYVSVPFFRPSELPQVVGVEAKENTRAVADFVRSLIGSERSVRAEIREDSQQYDMVLGINNKSEHRIVYCQLKREAFQTGLRNCASEVNRVLNPPLYLLTMYEDESAACGRKETCPFPRTEEFAQEMLWTLEPEQAKWARTILALAYIGEGHNTSAADELELLPKDPTLAQAEFVMALTKFNDDEAIPILRDVIAKDPGLLGANMILFTKLLFYRVLPVYPPSTFLKEDSPEVRELESIIHRVAGMKGATAEYHATRMRAALDSRTAYTFRAMDTLEKLIKSDPKDALAVAQMGDVQWTQSYIETSPVEKSKFLAKAAGYYWAAMKIDPNWELPGDRLAADIGLLQTVGDLSGLKEIANNEQDKSIDYAPVLMEVAERKCDVATFMHYSKVVANEKPEYLDLLWNAGPEVRTGDLGKGLYRVAKARSVRAAQVWCDKDRRDSADRGDSAVFK